MTPASPDQLAKAERISAGIALAALLVLYALCAYWVVVAARDVLTPCASNFEGGCSMGKQMVLLMSLAPALAALIIAIIGSRLQAVATLGRAAPLVRAIVIGVPACYLLWGLGIQFL